MLRVYFNLGYCLACSLLIEESLKCNIDNKTTKELSDMRSSYRLAKLKKYVKDGEYLLDKFLTKSNPYPFITHAA